MIWFFKKKDIDNCNNNAHEDARRFCSRGTPKRGLDGVLEQYIASAQSHANASQSGKYKIANKQYAIIKRIYDEHGGNPEFRKRLKELLETGQPSTILWAAAHLLGLNSDIVEAQAALENLSKRDDIRMISFSSQMTLKVWKEQGYLKF